MFKITSPLPTSPEGGGAGTVERPNSCLLGELEGAWGDTFIIAWTTTPWSLPANTGLTVGPKIEDVTVKTYNHYTFLPVTIIVAKDLAEKQFDKKFKKIE